MATPYIATYTISTDTLNGAVNIKTLSDEIRFSEITISVESIKASDDNLTIYFRAMISETNSALLDSIVSEHEGVEITEVELVRNQSEPFSIKGDTEGHRFFKRIHGSDAVEVAPGASETVEIDIAYPWAKIEAMEIIGAGNHHTVDLLILDTESNTYSKAPVEAVGGYYPLNQFAYDVNIRKDFYRFSSKYDADLYFGMVVRVIVSNNSTEASKVSLNIELNEVTS